MALFNFGKKKAEGKKDSACACSCSGNDAEKITNEYCGGTENIYCIKVLGAGCASCHRQYEYAKKAVKNMDLSIEIEYITDMTKIMEYGVMSMPAIVVNEKVVAMGKVLNDADIVKLLEKAGNANG